MEQLEHTNLCKGEIFSENSSNCIFLHFLLYLGRFFLIGCSAESTNVKYPKFKICIQKLKVFEKYRTFSGKLDGSPKSSFYSHHIPILNFVFCDGSNNLILGFSGFIRILKKWVKGIWN